MQGLETLRQFIENIPTRLLKLAPEKVVAKPASEKWSPKEELGHLLDSAANNHQRVVRVQLHDKLVMPGYEQEHWVRLHAYQQRDWQELIELWRVLNLQLLAAAKSVPDAAWAHTCTIDNSEPMTLEFVFVDYLRHMKHHLEHIGVKVDDLQ